MLAATVNLAGRILGGHCTGGDGKLCGPGKTASSFEAQPGAAVKTNVSGFNHRSAETQNKITFSVLLWLPEKCFCGEKPSGYCITALACVHLRPELDSTERSTQITPRSCRSQVEGNPKTPAATSQLSLRAS
jgi:hypothetical protein